MWCLTVLVPVIGVRTRRKSSNYVRSNGCEISGLIVKYKYLNLLYRIFSCFDWLLMGDVCDNWYGFASRTDGCGTASNDLFILSCCVEWYYFVWNLFGGI
jgi:hypothetical protein